MGGSKGLYRVYRGIEKITKTTTFCWVYLGFRVQGLQ